MEQNGLLNYERNTMKQVLSELSEYLKQLRKCKTPNARRQCVLLSPMEKALRILIEQKGNSTGSAKPHYEKKYKALYSALQSAVRQPSYYNYFLPTDSLDSFLVKLLVPTQGVHALSWPCLTIGELLSQIKKEVQEEAARTVKQHTEYLLLLKKLKKTFSTEQIDILKDIKGNPNSWRLSPGDLLCP